MVISYSSLGSCQIELTTAQSQSQEDVDQLIEETWKRMQTEQKIMGATELLGQATSNAEVLRQNKAKIKETQLRLTYFEQTLGKLQIRKARLMQGDDPSRFAGGLPPQVSSLELPQLPYSHLKYRSLLKNMILHLVVTLVYQNKGCLAAILVC